MPAATPERAVSQVARVFYVFAWVGVASTVWSLLQGHLSLDLNMFGFMIAAGLREFDFSFQPSVYGIPFERIPRALLVTMLAVDLGISVWQLLVLRRADVRAQFHEPWIPAATAAPFA